MKKIVDGKLYDTDKATMIGRRVFANPREFEYVDEALYRTERGAYFIAGEGGAMSSYARPVEVGGGWQGGEGLTVVERETAKRWAERYLEVEEYMEHFEVDEG